MIGWYEGLSILERLFLVVATGGSTVFIIQFVMMMTGSDGGDSADVGGDLSGGDSGDVSAPDEPGHVDSDAGFKLLSLQSLSTFFMMFGFVGLAFSKGGGYSAFASIIGGLAAGSLTMYLVSKAFMFFRSLQSSGTISLKNGVGKQARVYLTIKADEPGQIELDIQGHLGIYDAVSEDKEEIPTDSSVIVTKVLNNMMFVKRTDRKG
ncbi:MAG: hypothetical protein JXR91_05175 [Deltaproteobacteria bacterium]|nr:hypothetical protein [Deltaproteobacteria bacterium]